MYLCVFIYECECVLLIKYVYGKEYDLFFYVAFVTWKYSFINNRATPYKEYVEALRAHFFIPKAKLANLEKVKMIDFRDVANEAANSDTSFGDNKKEFLEMLKSQFFIAKTETEMSRKVKIINSPTEEKENLNSDPGFSNNKNDFKEDNSYTLAVVRNRRKMLRDESGESEKRSSWWSGMYVCMYVCLYACMYACMYVKTLSFACM